MFWCKNTPTFKWQRAETALLIADSPEEALNKVCELCLNCRDHKDNHRYAQDSQASKIEVGSLHLKLRSHFVNIYILITTS